MKMMDGAKTRAASNRQRTSFSLSPRYFEANVDAIQLKNTDFSILATALAIIVFPERT
jgi:hypothetical protein